MKKKKKPKTSYVYILCDPDTMRACFVGATTDIKRKMAQITHLAKVGQKNYISDWVRSLQYVDKTPRLEILEAVDGDSNQHISRWISYYKDTKGTKIKRV
jgi:hypothetical protein